MTSHSPSLPDAIPVANLLYAPSRAGGISSRPDAGLPREDLLTSYERQWYRFEWEGRHYALRPNDDTIAPFNPLWPAPCAPGGDLAKRLSAGFILSAWHRQGVTSNQSQRHSQWNMLRELVKKTGTPHMVMGALQSGSQWVEPVLLASGMTGEQARLISQKMGQRVAIELAQGQHRPHILGGPRARSYSWALHPLPAAPCALSLGCEVSYSPKKVGGPYGSRAIEVASLWSAHRRLSHDILPCSPCRSGAPVATLSGKDISGVPLALTEVLPATRYTYSRHTRAGEGPPAAHSWPPATERGVDRVR